MDYVIALEEGKFDKYICLSNIIDILCLVSTECTSYYIASYLKYHKFHTKAKAYYIDVSSAEVLPIYNQSEIITSLFEDIKNAPLTLNTIREMPIELAGRLGDIYFISDELTNLDVFEKFGYPDFTDMQMMDKLLNENYANEQVIVRKRLHDLALNSQVKIDKNGLISINEIPELISRFFYQFIIRFDSLVLLSIDDFTPKKNQFISTFDNGKLQLFEKSNEDDIDIEQNEVKALREKVKRLAAENEILKAKLNDELNQTKAEVADDTADEVELNPKTQTAVTRLLNVLFHKARLDITAHKGTTNKNIVNSSISLNAKITEKPVSHWIKQVQQLRIDTEKR